MHTIRDLSIRRSIALGSKRCLDQKLAWRWAATSVLALLLIGAATGRGRAQQIEQTSMILKASAVVDSNGTSHLDATIKFDPPRIYDRIKRAYPNLYVLFRDLIASDRASSEVDREATKIEAYDGTQTISFKTNVLGFAVCRDNRWQIHLSKGEGVVTQEGNKVITSLVSTLQVGTILNGTGVYMLPPGAQNIHVDPESSLLTYTLPKPVTKAVGTPQIDLNVRYQHNIMSSVYKVYADPEVANGRYWVAKTVVKNTGSAPLYGLKISYSMGEFADANTPEAYSVVLPKGAVVDCYYPLFASRVAQLKTRTPAHLHVRCEYKDAAGKTYTEERTELVSILGINQFQYSNLTEAERTDSWFDTNDNYALLAAYVTKIDDPVKQLAGYISEAAGGAGAAIDAKSALKWLEAAYDMELLNNIVYQTPSGNSFSQDIKYPRDVFRAKSGTCIDLAICYATLAESVGLRAYLMLVPGHCFSVIRLPDGSLVPVENTGLGGGDQRMSFAQANKCAVKEFNDYQQQGLFHFIDVETLQDQGHIPSPELPALESNFLETCGIKRIGAIAENGLNPGVIGHQDQNPNPQPDVSATTGPVEDAKDFNGMWKGTAGSVTLILKIDQTDTLANGTLMTQGAFNVSGDFRKAPIKGGKSIKLHVRAVGDGLKMSIDLDGTRDGNVIKGIGKVVERGQLDIPLSTRNVTWQVRYTGK